MKLDWGISEIFDLEFDADAGHQFAAVESQAWDVKNLQMTDPDSAKSVSASQGNLDAQKIASTLGFDKYSLISPVPIESAELKVWADGTMARSRAAMLRGQNLDPWGQAPQAFGCHRVGRLRRSLQREDAGHWVEPSRQRRMAGSPTCNSGVSPQAVFEQAKTSLDAPAAGLIPGLVGLQIGIVTDTGDDPEKEFRVKVKLPGITTGDATVWARLCAPDAGNQRGYFFRPEVGDEVVVGFLNNDPRHPVVLGSLFGSKNAPPDDLAKELDKNKFKGIVTRKGTKISFLDDDKSSVFIQTPGNNKILLDDDAKAIKLTDQNGNTVTMDENGIEMKSAKDFTIDASSGNVEIKGSAVDVK